jgi:phosphoribosylaminoimidazolecarboxamide formyltransferase / IMP cyclohydrolase
VTIRRALVSVYDKTGLAELAQGLHAAGVQIVSTGSTAKAIEAAGVPVTEVSALTGFPEALDGRVKTLHPVVHAGLLADVANPDHVRQLTELGIEPFQLLVSNLYPFAATVASGAGAAECVEQTDIGGPAMIRAAAKNHAHVAVVVSPSRYPDVLAALDAGDFTLAQRRALAAEAYAHTASYDAAVASWYAGEYAGEYASELVEGDDDRWPEFAASTIRRKVVLRYGENPHQPAALYTEDGAEPGLAQATQLHGKEMSFNNYTDADAARRAAYDFAEPCVAIIKHANPCGLATGVDVADAHRKAHACDPGSAYGGVIAVNRPVTVTMAEQVAEVFTEVLVAPEYDPEALDVLRTRKNIRLLTCPPPSRTGVERRPVSGGMLLQVRDALDAPGDDPATWRLVSGEPVDEATLRDLAFAWRAIRAVKSNAILLAHDTATVGVGMGQVNRVDSARLAVARAGERAAGSVAASDAYFPFPDGLQVLLEAKVRAVVQPGGSIRDEDSIGVAQAAGVPMYLTATRHFAH